MTHLYLIRHGEAMGAVTKRVADQVGECGLSPLGRTQAARLRDRLQATGEIAADVLIASTFPRARETAEIVAPALGLTPILDDEVQELRSGAADGLLYEDFRARYGRPDFDNAPFRPIAPGGESWSSFQVRMGGALARITAEHAGKTIVIVCHGGIIDGSLLYFMGLSPLARPRFALFTHNTAITHWERQERESGARWRLVQYNDDLHLREGIHWGGVAAVAATGADAPAVPLPTEDREIAPEAR